MPKQLTGALGTEQFLKLYVTQLQHQDHPMCHGLNIANQLA